MKTIQRQFTHTGCGWLSSAPLSKRRIMPPSVYNGCANSLMLEDLCPSKTIFWWAIILACCERVSNYALHCALSLRSHPGTSCPVGCRSKRSSLSLMILFLCCCVTSKSLFATSSKSVKRNQVQTISNFIAVTNGSRVYLKFVSLLSWLMRESASFLFVGICFQKSFNSGCNAVASAQNNLLEVYSLHSVFIVSLNRIFTLLIAAGQASNKAVDAALGEFPVQASQAVRCVDACAMCWCICRRSLYGLIASNRCLDRLPSEFDALQLRFKPLVPAQPRPQLLLRHVSENLPLNSSAPAAYSTGNDYGQAKTGNTLAQRIFECMKTLIEKQRLSEQVRCGSFNFVLFFKMLYHRTFSSFTSVSLWAKTT